MRPETMHDLHEADKILKLILEHGRRNNLKQITEASIALGSIIEHEQEIQPENLIFNLKMLARNTICQDMEIKITRTKSGFWQLLEIKGQ